MFVETFSCSSYDDNAADLVGLLDSPLQKERVELATSAHLVVEKRFDDLNGKLMRAQFFVGIYRKHFPFA